MEVVNILSDGTEIEDISTITVPKDSMIYNICAEIERRNEKAN